MKKFYVLLISFLLFFGGLDAQNLSRSEYVIISFEHKGKNNEWDNYLFHWIVPFDSININRVNLVPLCTEPMFFQFEKKKENRTIKDNSFVNDQIEKSIGDLETIVRQNKKLIQKISTFWTYKLDVSTKNLIDVIKRHPVTLKVYATLVSGFFATGDFCYKTGIGGSHERSGWCHAFIPIGDFQIINLNNCYVSQIMNCIVNMDYSFIDYTYSRPDGYKEVRRFKATQNNIK